jgi:hypothetical protein
MGGWTVCRAAAAAVTAKSARTVRVHGDLWVGFKAYLWRNNIACVGLVAAVFGMSDADGHAAIAQIA